jgi:hypothetical protein
MNAAARVGGTEPKPGIDGWPLKFRFHELTRVLESHHPRRFSQAHCGLYPGGRGAYFLEA